MSRFPLLDSWSRFTLDNSSLNLHFHNLTYSLIGLILFIFYRAIDLKMIVGGGVYSYNEDDYLLAAVNVILDVQVYWYSLIFVNCIKFGEY